MCTSPAPLRSAPTSTRRAAPRIAGAAGDDADRAVPLVGVRGRRGHHAATSRPPRGAPSPRHVEADVDDVDVAAPFRPRPNSIPGLTAWNVTVRSAASTRPRTSRAGVDPARDVDRQHALQADRRGVPRRPGEAGAEGGVDDQIGRRAASAAHRPRRRRAPARRGRCSHSAATLPSAPLLPGPAMTTTCGRTPRRASAGGPTDRPTGRGSAPPSVPVRPRRSPASPRR